MKLPDLISALERNEYAEVLRGTKYEGAKYEGHSQDPMPNEEMFKLEQDMTANAATVTVLRLAVRELVSALGHALPAVEALSLNSETALTWGKIAHDGYKLITVAAPLVNENNNESVKA